MNGRVSNWEIELLQLALELVYLPAQLTVMPRDWSRMTCRTVGWNSRNTAHQSLFWQLCTVGWNLMKMAHWLLCHFYDISKWLTKTWHSGLKLDNLQSLAVTQSFGHFTVILNTLKNKQKYSTVPQAQEQVSELTSEWVSAAERVSEASSAEQASKRCEQMSEWSTTNAPILRSSESLCTCLMT